MNPSAPVTTAVFFIRFSRAIMDVDQNNQDKECQEGCNLKYPVEFCQSVSWVTSQL